MLRAVAASSLADRMLRAAKLDPAAYEEVEHDRAATGQAAFVVVATSIAAAIGAGGSEGFGSFVGIGALVGWAIYAWLAYVIGTRLLRGPRTQADWGQVARALGFANVPRFALLLGVIPGLYDLVELGVAIWVIAATVVALRAALDFSTRRAVATAVVSALVPVVLAFALGI